MTLTSQPSKSDAAVEHSRKQTQTFSRETFGERLGVLRHPGWVTGLPVFMTPDPSVKLPALVAVGGGKGGVGKSLLAANLGVHFAKLGLKVLVVDLDFGGANLQTYFAQPASAAVSLADFAMMPQRRFEDVVCKTQVANLFLVPGAKEEAWSRNGILDPVVLGKVWSGILSSRESLGIDLVVMDLGAGTHKHTMDFFTAAHVGIVTVLPEPTSIENAYMFLKAFLWRMIENIGDRHETPDIAAIIKQELLQSEAAQKGLLGKTVADRLQAMSLRFPRFLRDLKSAIDGRVTGFVVNQSRNQQDIDIAKSMDTIANRYFGFNTTCLGYLNYDDAAWKALRSRRVLTVDFPQSTISKRVGEVALKVMRSLG